MENKKRAESDDDRSSDDDYIPGKDTESDDDSDTSTSSSTSDSSGPEHHRRRSKRQKSAKPSSGPVTRQTFNKQKSIVHLVTSSSDSSDSEPETNSRKRNSRRKNKALKEEKEEEEEMKGSGNTPSPSLMEALEHKMRENKDTGLRASRSLTRKRKRAAVPNTLLPQPPIYPKNLDELILLAKKCKKKLFKDCQLLYPMLKPLLELQSMIGLEKLKHQVFEMLVMRLQKKNLQVPKMGHMLLFGPPGVGKSTFVPILAQLLSILGCTASNKVVFGKPSNMIGRYLGSTPIITEQLIQERVWRRACD